MLYNVKLDKIKSKKLRHYMINYMSIIITVTSVFSVLSKDEHWIKEKNKLWKELQKKNKKLYNELMFSFLGLGVNVPGKAGEIITIGGYKLSQLIYGFN